MNSFRWIPEKKYALSETGVIVHTCSHDYEGGDIVYEVGGNKYYIPFDRDGYGIKIRLASARSCEYAWDAQPMLAQQLRIRMWEDLPNALTALGLGDRMEFGFSRIRDTNCVSDGIGVYVDFGYGRHSISCEANGVKYEVNDFTPESAGRYTHERELDMSNIWLAGKGPDSRPLVTQEALARMRNDLPKAYAAFGLKFKFKK